MDTEDIGFFVGAALVVIPGGIAMAMLLSTLGKLSSQKGQPVGLNTNEPDNQAPHSTSGLEAYLPHAPNFQRYLQGMGQLTVNEDTSAGFPSTGWHRREFMVSINGQEWGDYWFHADGKRLLTQGYTATSEIKGNPSLLRMNHVKDERGDIYRDVPFP